MKFNLRIRPAADADVDDAALFIAQDNLEAALRFYNAVDRTYRQIQEHPERWPRYDLDHPQLAGLRKRSVVRYKNYLVFYLVDNGSVEIIRVLHGARDIPAVIAEDFVEE
jgi:toxin ParE1/3/4